MSSQSRKSKSKSLPPEALLLSNILIFKSIEPAVLEIEISDFFTERLLT
jgi:hypothetical protein